MTDNTQDTNVQDINNTQDTRPIKELVQEILDYKNHPSVLRVKSTNINMYNFMMEQKFNDFNLNYPILFRTIIKDEDLTILYKMIDMIKKIENKEIEKFEGEVELGKMLADKYVYPKINK